MELMMTVLGLVILGSGWWGRWEVPVGLGVFAAVIFGWFLDTPFNTLPVMALGGGMAYLVAERRRNGRRDISGE
ncbi:hypothetical protein [Aurantiacibacter hainanensis]|uniref:hypothetical protein n=1 Tax=Aurantiacibacter hainanensis TaxID=3076114 RepID=UPI0030C6AB72